MQKSPHGISYKSLLILAGMLIVSGVQPFQVSAQEVNIGSGACLVNSGTMVVVNNAGIVNTGTITNIATGAISLSGNWQNDGVYSGAAGSTVALEGDSAQTIGGANATTFSNLTLNNSSGFTLLNNIGVNGILDFQGGLLTTGNFLVTIGSAGSISGAGASQYVNGKLAVTYGAPASKFFPVGKGGNYHPLTLQYTSITGTSVVTAEQFETPLTGALPSGITLLTTNRSWTITQTGGSSLQYFLTLDPIGLTPTHSVMMLKQDAGTIASFATNSPYYTNTGALTTFSEFGLGEGQGYNLMGSFRYPNSAHTPLDSTGVIIKQNNIPLDATLTGQAGSFAFSNKTNGTYTISASTTRPWSGVNATDALKVRRHYTGIETLTEPVRLQAADVDNNNLINDKDEIKIKRRFAGLDNYFEHGDWTFAKPTGGDTVIISGSHVNQNFYGLCVGDVTGSNIPGTGSTGSGFLALVYNDTIKASPGEVIEIPLKVTSEAIIGAISIVAAYPGNLMQVNDVKIQEGTPYYTGNNGLRMAWSEASPLSLSKDQTMITLVVKISEQFSKNDQIRLTLDKESEIANSEGVAFDTLILNFPMIIYKYGEGMEDNKPATKFEVYPVPNNGEFNAEITSADQKIFSIRIYNQLGQVIREVKDIIVKGKKIQRFEQGNLPNGIYTVVLRNETGSETRKIVIKH